MSTFGRYTGSGDATKEAAFKRWFAGSTITEADGVTPRVLYHGTTATFTEFQLPKKELGIHFGTIEQAVEFVTLNLNDKVVQARWATGELKPNIMPVYLSVKKPLRLPDLSGWWAEEVSDYLRWLDDDEADAIVQQAERDAEGAIKRVRKALDAKGYDAIVYRNKYEGDLQADSYIVWHPGQIKSIHNRGTFDPADANILNGIRGR